MNGPTHFVASIELDRPIPDQDEQIDALMDALVDVHGALGAAPNGNLILTITIPAENLRQATSLALTVAAPHGNPIAITATPEALRDHREGLAPLPELLSTTQAAQRLGMTRQGIAAAIKAGNLQAITIGDHIQAIPAPALAAYATSRRH